MAPKSAMRHAREQIQKMNTYLCGEKNKEKKNRSVKVMNILDSISFMLFDIVYIFCGIVQQMKL